MYMMCVEHMCYGACVEFERWLVESAFPFYFYLCFRDWTQDIRLTSSGRKHLYPLNHLIAPSFLLPSPSLLHFFLLFSSPLSISSCPSLCVSCSPRWPQICYVGKDDLELLILHPLPITPSYSVLGIKPRPSHILINYPTSPVFQILTSNIQHFKNLKASSGDASPLTALSLEHRWDFAAGFFFFFSLGAFRQLAYFTSKAEPGLWSIDSHIWPSLCRLPPWPLSICFCRC